MIYVFLADGFEEVEALCPIDLLRRAGADVRLVGVTGKMVEGAHGIRIEADITADEIVLDRSLELTEDGVVLGQIYHVAKVSLAQVDGTDIKRFGLFAHNAQRNAADTAVTIDGNANWHEKTPY